MDSRKIFKLINKTTIVAALCLSLSACSKGGAEGRTAAESETEEESLLSIQQDTEEETKPVIRMEADGDILPILGDVTTAEDNSVLAPAYLKVGDKHQVVKILQEQLMAYGYMDNDEATTYYGNATAESVKRFQRQQKMTQDGICGTETWDKLFAADVPYYKVSNGDDGDDILRIQQRLYELGYLSADSVTGHFGDTTETVFQWSSHK